MLLAKKKINCTYEFFKPNIMFRKNEKKKANKICFNRGMKVYNADRKENRDWVGRGRGEEGKKSPWENTLASYIATMLHMNTR